MPALSKEDLLTFKPKIEAVAVSEMGDDAVVYLREVNAAGIVGFITLWTELEGKTPERLMVSLLSRAICDADGRRLFEDDESPIDTLTFVVANRLYQAAMRLNGIVDTDTPKKSSENNPSSTLHVA
jgi:hypothetical protein